MTFVIVLAVVLVVVLIVGIASASMYNRFVAQRNLIQESWRQIDVELRRRYDLIPQLVETVKGYASHERGTLDELTRLRTQAVSGTSSDGPPDAGTEQAISNTLRSLMVSVEAYPDLKANQNFAELQRQLADTEDRIANGRRYYNSNVRSYNTRLESFPSSILGRFGHFEQAQYFELTDPDARQAPKIDFGTSGPATRPSTPPAAVEPSSAQPAAPAMDQPQPLAEPAPAPRADDPTR